MENFFFKFNYLGVYAKAKAVEINKNLNDPNFV
jgi:hypothetical protein